MNLKRQECLEISQGNAALSQEALQYYAYNVLYEARWAGRRIRRKDWGASASCASG